MILMLSLYFFIFSIRDFCIKKPSLSSKNTERGTSHPPNGLDEKEESDFENDSYFREDVVKLFSYFYSK